MDPQHRIRAQATRWALADSGTTGRRPTDFECALQRANSLLELVEGYYRTAQKLLGDGDELTSLAPVIDALYLHAERMGSAALLARDVNSAFPPGAARALGDS
jgi:hypothetical protein